MRDTSTASPPPAAPEHDRVRERTTPVAAGVLGPSDLRRRYDPNELPFATTNEVAEIAEPVGQPRAVTAMQLATAIASPGHNVFAFGLPGTAPRELVARLLADVAAKRPVPPDVCYVHNVTDPRKPSLLIVPAGRGAALRRDMEQLIDELRPALTAAFEAEEFRRRREAIDEEAKTQPQRLLADLSERAQKDGLALVHTPIGFGFAFVKGKEPLSDEEIAQLPAEERERLQARWQSLQRELGAILRQVPGWERARHAKVRDLEREVVRASVGHLVDEVRKKYETLPNVVEYLERMEGDLVENARQLLEEDTSATPPFVEVSYGHGARRGGLRRYQVNVLVDHAATTGAPIVAEDSPSYDNLIGHIEHMAQFGTLVTDFNLIRAGACHRASGGYLILDALRVLQLPFAWDALKRVLEAGRVCIEPAAQLLGFASTVSLEPEPMGVDVRVVLTGEPWLYYLLSDHDPQFARLFKVAADVAEDLEASAEERDRYVRLVATMARQERLRAFDRTAVAQLLEESTRMAGDKERLSLRVDRLRDLMREADHLAGVVGAEQVLATHVDAAAQAHVYRADRLHKRLQEEIACGTIMIDTAGAKIGQANGLSVFALGGQFFGRPSRITARVRLGEGRVVDIEREVALGGPVHSKGVMILAAFLGGRYALDYPLSLHGSLVFEQSYSAVEGDSASAAELCALLSTIAEVPLSQSLAVTGSVNQQGQVQAVGGINEKIEGFFDVCRVTGLTGEQGVIIPKANVRHLMVRQDVVDAVAAGRFRILAVTTVDEAMSALTGLPAGVRGPTGEFPVGSLNQLVELRLVDLAQKRHEFDVPIELAFAPGGGPIQVVRHAPGATEGQR